MTRAADGRGAAASFLTGCVAAVVALAAGVAPAMAAAQVAFPERSAGSPAVLPTPDAGVYGAATTTLYDRAVALLATRAPEDLERSLELFSRVARREPVHARAHAGAATAASLLALYSVDPPGPLFAIARTAAAEALRLDPTLAQAHAAMGLVSYLDAWDFVAAETSLREAVRLDPRFATAWHWYGMLLHATGRHQESIEAFDRALAADPGSSLYRTKRAAVLAAAGRAAKAEEELRAVVGRAPESQLAHRELGYLLLAEKRESEGVAALRRAAELQGAGEQGTPDLAWAYARTGRVQDAESILRALLERGGFDFVPPLDVALIYAGLGRGDEAFRWIETALEIRDPGLVYLATAPGFAPLRADPRFAAAVAKVGLASEAPPRAAERGR
jgi:tetratricopeptide (TPR) repeat protein